jgi:type VI secretion system protein ImpL
MKQVGVWLFVLCLFVLGSVLIWVENPLLPPGTGLEQWPSTAVLLAVCLLIFFLESLGLFASKKLAALAFVARLREKLGVAAPGAARAKPDSQWAELRAHLRETYGLFWRFRVRFLLVVGEPEQVHAIAPGLTAQRCWLEGQATVLLWGGSVQSEPASESVTRWRELSRWRSLDGAVWAVNEDQCGDATFMAAGVLRLLTVARALGWRLPLHLWQVCASEWSQAGRKTQPVGCLLPADLTVQMLEARLNDLLQPMRRLGVEQMQGHTERDFLFRLSYELQTKGIARWGQAVVPMLPLCARGVPLRGVWFSLPLPDVSSAGTDRHWLMDAAWQGVVGQRCARRRLGWTIQRIGHVALLGVAALWCTGLLLSYAANRALITHVQGTLHTLQQPGAANAQLMALKDLVLELQRLEYRARVGEPLYLRFGLSRNAALLEALWPRYVEMNTRLIRDPAAANLQRQLTALVDLPLNSEERARRVQAAYDQLKAYLMLAQPQKVNAAFLSTTLAIAEPTRSGVGPELWRMLAPELWQFYAANLAAHPGWAIEADPGLVAKTRHLLLRELGQRNGETSLYQQVISAASNDYPALSLQQMVGDTDARVLFSSSADVPGVFTRQAWEGSVREGIDTIARQRREKIDWVLSDNTADSAGELGADQLRERLTARYFQDYSTAWLKMLNSLRWRPAGSLAGAIDQLTVMTDSRQSPLIALMNTLAFQGQAGARSQPLADSLMQSAKTLMGTEKVAVLDSHLQRPAGPLDATFGPLLALLGEERANAQGDDNLSLQTYLTRLTRVRLKLQQVDSAADPQEMIQAMAQTVFQGKRLELTDTQSYGNLIAASLGSEWAGAGQTLFAQPLEQAWRLILRPAAASLDSEWQRAIGSEWQRAFTGRYPFANTDSDSSLPMLGQMIRADSGRIEQFLHRQLRGVVRKEGGQWRADPLHSQGLRINPTFLTAINQLSQLADVLYTDGGLGVSFELRAKPVRDVVQTTLILNGEKLHYFNQMERWRRFNWPGRSDHPGANLTWGHIRSGERLFGDFQGVWGFIRLLERAQVTVLDDANSLYRVVLTAPDGVGLTWHLRSELGEGPLALLALRGFTLPQQIFLTDAAK